MKVTVADKAIIDAETSPLTKEGEEYLFALRAGFRRELREGIASVESIDWMMDSGAVRDQKRDKLLIAIAKALLR
jgi:hypothetical protein